jgi:hypothetical protein
MSLEKLIWWPIYMLMGASLGIAIWTLFGIGPTIGYLGAAIGSVQWRANYPA